MPILAYLYMFMYVCVYTEFMEVCVRELKREKNLTG